MLREYCAVPNFDDEGFVGIKFQDGHPQINFPRGYTLSDDDNAVRKDILGLIAVLRNFSKRQEGQNSGETMDAATDFPILSYQYVINDFISHGYYTESEVDYKLNGRGKINWKRTIQKVRPHINQRNVVYLDVIAKQSINKTNILTRIHEFCVYESFSKLGWLYLSSSYLPMKPSLPFNKKQFLAVLRDALKETFNNDKKRLFSSMIEIVNGIGTQVGKEGFRFGVFGFEHVWQNLVDYVFGESNKEIYFPHAKWHIVKGNDHQSSALEPDTIMKVDDKVFILDAKYYKYGITRTSGHLPATSSIQKQITYGEYVVAKNFAKSDDVYNAFILPYTGENGTHFEFASVGLAEWINYSDKTENYKYVLAILLDTKYIMQTYARHDAKEILELSEFILDSIREYRSS